MAAENDRAGRLGRPQEHQIKSRDRVRDRGEVFTAEREVKAMVDLVNDMATKVDTDVGTFLEPACGDGNFLIEILRRKCAALKLARKPLARDAERYAFRLAWALSSLYGIDIMPDNVAACRKRLRDFVLAEFDGVVRGKDNGARKELEDAVDVITGLNIVEGDALKYKTNDGHPIVFCKWRAQDGQDGTFRFGVTPYYFDTMAGDEKKDELFAIRDDLPRSPQYDFYAIRKVEEFMRQFGRARTPSAPQHGHSQTTPAPQHGRVGVPSPTATEGSLS